VADNPLAKKLLLKPGQRAAVINAPPGYADRLQPLPAGVELSHTPGKDLDFLQVFVKNVAEVEHVAVPAIQAVKHDGLLWVCYPKGGKKAGTDLNRDILWQHLSTHGIQGVALVALDDTWSAMRFRPAEKVGT
jgi:hypothetical protein